MAKGLFTQGMCVLLKQPMSLDQIQERLKGLELVGQQESLEDSDAPNTLVYAYRTEVGGHLLVTPSDIPWPDDMGDPDETPERFVAWSLGQFGPLAFPGGLARATTQSWGWEEAAEVAEDHTCHVRLLISYVMGGEEDDDDLPLVPEDYDALSELHFLTRAVTQLLESPLASCYFNPGGEILRDASGLRQGLNYAWCHELPPLDMWTNVRVFTDEEDWVVMDTVGNGQFDLPDMEAIYRREAYEPSEVENFLRHATLYLLAGDEEVCTGDTADGPGDRSWAALECGQSLSDPPRPTVRWFPEDDHVVPEHLLDPGDDEPDEDEIEEYLSDADDDVESFLDDHDFGNDHVEEPLDDADDGDDPPGMAPF